MILIRICFIAFDVNPPWVEASRKQIISLAKFLNSQNHKVIIFTTYPRLMKNKNNSLQSQIKNISFYRSKNLFFNIFNNEKSLNHLISQLSLTIDSITKINKNEFDLIHGFSGAPLLAYRSLFSGKFADVPQIHSLVSKSHIQGLGSSFFTQHLNFLNKITVNTKDLKKKLSQKNISNVELIFEGIDTKEFCPKARSNIREEIGIGNSPLILYVGHLMKEKGVEYLVKSAPKIIRKFPKAHFLIAYSGIGENFNKIKKLISNLSLKDNFTIIGKREDLPGIYASSDIFVSPLTTDKATVGNPLTILEALASKTPVIATNVSIVREIISHKENGWIVSPKSENEIADAVVEILNSKKLSNTLSKKGRELVLNKYNSKQRHEMFLEIYKSLVDNK